MRVRSGIGPVVAAVALALALTSGCGVGSGDVEDGGEAPTGLAAGTTLFFLDADGRLRPSMRDTGRLGTMLGAIQLLLTADSQSDTGVPELHSEIPPSNVGPIVDDAGGYVTIRLPIAGDRIGPAGIDQVICTATSVVVASGRDPDDVKISVFPTSGEEFTRPCPVLG